MWNRIRLLTALVSAGMSLAIVISTSGCEDGDVSISTVPYWI